MFGKKNAAKLLKDQEKRAKIEAKYKHVLSKHFSLIEKYEKAYSVALKAGANSLLMLSVIHMAKEDMGLSHKIKDYCREIGDPLYTLPAYKRLVIIYEKQKKYDDAIKICDASIKLGHKAADFRARKAKLITKKKQGAEKEKTAKEKKATKTASK